MAVLIIQHQDRTAGGVIQGSVIIGREPGNAVVVDDRRVSRRHAKIVRAGDDYFISDMDSRTGTLVNGKPIDRQQLEEGDEIAIGPAKLVFRRGAALPAGVRPMPLIATGTFKADKSDRRRFGCSCGKTVEVALPLEAKYSKCRSCGQIIRIPDPATPTESPRPVTADQVESCSVCLCSMEAVDGLTSCPECGQRFHAECWTENRGCSAYGCAQVGALDAHSENSEMPPYVPAEMAEDMNVVDEATAPSSSREAIVLAASIVASLAGMLTFGVPALLVGGGTIVYMARHPSRRRSRRMLLSAALSGVGLCAGLAVSSFWWLNALPWGGRLR